MPGAKEGTLLFDWDAETITEYNVIQPKDVSANRLAPMASTAP